MQLGGRANVERATRFAVENIPQPAGQVALADFLMQQVSSSSSSSTAKKKPAAEPAEPDNDTAAAAAAFERAYDAAKVRLSGGSDGDSAHSLPLTFTAGCVARMYVCAAQAVMGVVQRHTRASLLAPPLGAHRSSAPGGPGAELVGIKAELQVRPGCGLGGWTAGGWGCVVSG